MTHSSHDASFVDAPTRTVTTAGTQFAYRELGAGDGVPLIALTHLGANLDCWDPELVDPLADGRRVILLGYRGVGGSTGTVRDRFDDMAADAIGAIHALGLSRVDLFGLSMGGMVVQSILEQEPELVDRVVLAGTGPQSGPRLTRMTGTMVRGILRGAAAFTPATSLLFFTRTQGGKRAAAEYQARLKRRRIGRDKAVGLDVLRAQLSAVKRWGEEKPSAAASTHTGPVLILHGDSDRMVPVGNVTWLQSRFIEPQVQVFPDSGHGVVSQNRQAVADIVDRFLRR